MSDLEDLIDLIATGWKFTPEEYPRIKNMSEEECFQFAIRHIALHMHKSTGRISAEYESSDHGNDMYQHIIEECSIKMLVNSLRLISLLNLDAEDVFERVSEQYTP